MVRNSLRDLHSDVANLPNLRVLNVAHNKLKNSAIPEGLFMLEDLSVVVSSQKTAITVLLFSLYKVLSIVYMYVHEQSVTC